MKLQTICGLIRCHIVVYKKNVYQFQHVLQWLFQRNQCSIHQMATMVCWGSLMILSLCPILTSYQDCQKFLLPCLCHSSSVVMKAGILLCQMASTSCENAVPDLFHYFLYLGHLNGNFAPGKWLIWLMSLLSWANSMALILSVNPTDSQTS